MSHPGIVSGPGLRDRYNAFIADHEVAWELVMAALTIAWVVTSFSFEEEQQSDALLAFDVAVWAILSAEFVTRLIASRERRAYLRGHWIDAIALIPAARSLWLLRLFRLIRLVRAFAGVPGHHALRRHHRDDHESHHRPGVRD